jgi:hypothetical protein
MAEVKFNSLPTTVVVDGESFPVTWLRVERYKKGGETDFDESGNEIETLEEEGDVWMPIPDVENLTPRIKTEIYKNIYFETEDDKGNPVYAQLGSDEIENFVTPKDKMDEALHYYSMVAKAINSGVVTGGDVTDNYGVSKALSTYSKSIAGGAPFDNTWLDKLSKIKKYIPSGLDYQNAGAKNLSQPVEWTRNMTTEPVQNTIRRIDDEITKLILSNDPTVYESKIQELEKQRIQSLQQNGMGTVALNMIQRLSPENRKDYYTQSLGRQLQTVAEDTSISSPIKEFGVQQYLNANPSNLATFEAALSQARQEAAERAKTEYPTADQDWATQRVLVEILPTKLQAMSQAPTSLEAAEGQMVTSDKTKDASTILASNANQDEIDNANRAEAEQRKKLRWETLVKKAREMSQTPRHIARI